MSVRNVSSSITNTWSTFTNSFGLSLILGKLFLYLCLILVGEFSLLIRFTFACIYVWVGFPVQVALIEYSIWSWLRLVQLLCLLLRLKTLVIVFRLLLLRKVERLLALRTKVVGVLMYPLLKTLTMENVVAGGYQDSFVNLPETHCASIIQLLTLNLISTNFGKAIHHFAQSPNLAEALQKLEEFYDEFDNHEDKEETESELEHYPES